LVSLLMDTSSELIHSLLPLFLVTSLGASALAVGAIEGVAEATALVTKVFSGYLSDYFRRRKLLTGLGYGLAALSKPLFALATSFAWVFAARNLVSGAALLIASVLAGWLWDAFGPTRTFYVGAGFTLLAILGLAVNRRHPASADRNSKDA
jgi:sugar phosphate permease